MTIAQITSEVSGIINDLETVRDEELLTNAISDLNDLEQRLEILVEEVDDDTEYQETMTILTEGRYLFEKTLEEIADNEDDFVNGGFINDDYYGDDEY